MRRRALLIAICGMAVACDRRPSEPIVADRHGDVVHALRRRARRHGAAGAEGGGRNRDRPVRHRRSLSNEAGNFSFEGVYRPMRVRVRKNGFHAFGRDNVVVGDRLLEVTLSSAEVVQVPRRYDPLENRLG